MKRFLLMAAAAMLVMSFAACGGKGGGAHPAGRWTGGTAPSSPFLNLADNGRVTGSDGCNALTGTWTAKGDNVTFTQMASTLMACPGVDTWLSKLAKATVYSDTMVVLDSTGKQIGTLKKST